MTIWVDADACPKIIKELLFKAAIKNKIQLVLVANAYIPYPTSVFIRCIQVSSGFDKADQSIIERVQSKDLVVTQDIQLAHEVLLKQAIAFNPRGEIFSPETIKARVTFKNYHEQLRSMGEYGLTQTAFGSKEKMAFAKALDQYIHKTLRL